MMSFQLRVVGRCPSPSALIEPDQTKDILCREAADRPSAVTGYHKAVIRANDEGRGMQELLFPVVVRAGRLRHFFRVQAIPDRISDSEFLNGLSGLFKRVNRSCDDLDPFRLEVLKVCLEISQLLITERSPVPPVYEEHPVSVCGVFREADHFP